MAKKRYCSNCSEFNIYLPIGKEQINLRFHGKNSLTKERFVDIEDKAIQEALEKSPSFGIYFYKSNEFAWTEVEEKPIIEEPKEEEIITPTEETEQEIIEKEFTSGTKAKSWLNKTFNIPLHKLSNNAKIKNEFAVLGIDLILTPKK